MFTHSFHKRVRYAETDKMGYLYYGNYAKYYEIGRVECLRSLGMTYKALEDEHGLIMPVVNMEIRYVSPAYYDDDILIKTILHEMPRSLITFHHELFSPGGDLINKAVVKLFFVDEKSGNRVQPPNEMIEKLAPFFE